LIAKPGGCELPGARIERRAGGNRMPDEDETRRQRIKALLERAENALSALRSTAVGHSRAIRLHLEREIHARNKDLALLDGPPGCSGNTSESTKKKQ
jgi:hypothetical protein